MTGSKTLIEISIKLIFASGMSRMAANAVCTTKPGNTISDQHETSPHN